MAKSDTQRSEVERIKQASDYLRGTIAAGLADPLTGAVSADDSQLTKFHGIYLQDDRDLRVERHRQKLEPHYQFMVRLRLPGGICTPDQWLKLDRIAQRFGHGTLRLTTRQTFQYHWIVKRELKPAIQAIDAACLDTLAACGDVNRNVICTTNPYQSAVHAATYDIAKALSEHLLPRTRAYYEIWLDREKVAGSEDHEPILGNSYLPRKFKTAVVVPPGNEVDVFAHDLGFIAIVEAEELAGFNVTAGGGMGMTHGEPETYPRLADVIGFCRPDQVIAVAEAVVTTQRDFGDRVNRKHARLKYTIEDRGVDWFRAEVERRLGWRLGPPRPFRFDSNGDRLGWVEGNNGKWHCTLLVENGRIRDHPDQPLMTGLREIAAVHDGDLRITANQNVMIGNVDPGNRARIERLIADYRLDTRRDQTVLRQNAMACVALPTCPLAMAESERYLPTLLDRLEQVIRAAGLADEAITLRMTGCPNGCARPNLAEIGLIGKAVGRYNLYLGGGFAGQRLNKLYRENIDEAEILAALTPLLHQYARERRQGERFGDFVIRQGHVAEVRNARSDFHA
jgi:sulfite reductase (NADPH) hemoprotein beta-component